MQSVLILGRQPELGLAELESLYGPEKIQPLSNQTVLVDIDPCLLAFKRLGGSLKFAKLLTILDGDNWQTVEDFLTSSAPEHSRKLEKGKMTLGLSVYGFKIDVRTISKSALSIKRAIQKTDRNVRIVPNKELTLNTAQVIHNKLTNNRSWELLIISSEGKTFIAQTVMVQDIEAYSKRDQTRPFRDSRVGMLPPKLAQIIINLAVGKLNEAQLQSICDIDPKDSQIVKLDQTVLDPFVGSGVLLQEASLMGYEVIGTDLYPRMVDYTKQNLQWLEKNNKTSLKLDKVFAGDARNTTWPAFDFVASEANLGKPINKFPSELELSKMIEELNSLIEDFLKNLASQTKSGLRLCIAIPAWQILPDNFRYLPLIDHLTDLGYNSVDFELIKKEQLIYYRPKQLVARHLLTLIRN